MANPVKTPVPAPTAGKTAPVTPATVPPTPAAPATPVATETKAKKEPKVKQQVFYGSEAEAKAEAEKRDGGARRPFKLEVKGETWFMVAHNPEHAGKHAFDKLGGVCTEIGKVAKEKAPKTLDASAIAGMLSSLSEADRAAVEKALADLKATKPAS